jgi:arylsulfatase A-like enzyme
MRFLPRFFVVLLAAFLLTGGEARAADKATRPTSVLLITVDTLRADHLSCYGYHRKTSPTFDQVAKEGALFTTAIAQRGVTWPSVTSIMTSLYPQTHGVRHNGHKLKPSFVTIAEVLHDQGFKTGAFLTSMGTASNRGFVEKVQRPKNDTKVTRLAIDFLQRKKSETFFMWVHYFAPHKQYSPPKPFRSMFDTGYDGSINGSNVKQLDQIMLNKVELSDADLGHIIALYDGEVAAVDSSINKLLAELDRLGRRDDTLVVLTSDHGEELFQHNQYFHHQLSIYESVLRIPLILRLPGVIPAGVMVESVVESIDIAPTILELLSMQIPDAFEGKSLARLVKGVAGTDSGDAPESVAYSEIVDKISSIRTSKWHYIYNPSGFVTTGMPYVKVKDERRNGYRIEEEELYDLVSDPGEQSNVVRDNRAVADRLRADLLEWRGPQTRPAPVQDFDEETLQELRDLGYIE